LTYYGSPGAGVYGDFGSIKDLADFYFIVGGGIAADSDGTAKLCANFRLIGKTRDVDEFAPCSFNYGWL
jgi:hypothetical protein